MLEIKNISKALFGKKILQNVNLTALPGQTLAIVGPSGAGKTTLLRIIAGLETFDTGKVVLDGVDVSSQLQTQLDGKIGVVFQDFNLFSQYTARQNIELPLKLTRKLSVSEAKTQSNSILEKLELTSQADNYPYQLSGGQKQRVAIARALTLNPEIILFDEPTSALDPELSNSVAALINGLKTSKTIQIVVTHDMEFAQKIADVTFTLNPIEK